MQGVAREDPLASPSTRTIPICFGNCDKCGRRFESRNAMGLAAQHFARCGGEIWLEVTRIYRWIPEGGGPDGRLDRPIDR